MKTLPSSALALLLAGGSLLSTTACDRDDELERERLIVIDDCSDIPVYAEFDDTPVRHGVRGAELAGECLTVAWSCCDCDAERPIVQRSPLTVFPPIYVVSIGAEDTDLVCVTTTPVEETFSLAGLPDEFELRFEGIDSLVIPVRR